MKKITGMLFIVSLLLCGCVQKIEDPAEASAKYPWIIATDSPKDTVTGLFAHKFAEEVERLSNGSIHMQVYENGTLGSDRELIESCMGQDIPSFCKTRHHNQFYAQAGNLRSAGCVYGY
ncbi:MAG: hypothetical protein ACLRL6_05025 [Clostridium sp.]